MYKMSNGNLNIKINFKEIKTVNSADVILWIIMYNLYCLLEAEFNVS